MKAIIKSIKHILQVPAVIIASGGVRNDILIASLAEGSARALVSDVEEGCVVKAIYLEFWISGVTADKTATWILAKYPNNIGTATFTETQNLSAWDNKSNILHTGQGLAPTGGNQIAMFKNWVMIPKGKQRFALGDRLILQTSAVGTNVNICGFALYKERS